MEELQKRLKKDWLPAVVFSLGPHATIYIQDPKMVRDLVVSNQAIIDKTNSE